MSSVNAQTDIFSSFLYKNGAVCTGAGYLQKWINLKMEQCERSLREQQLIHSPYNSNAQVAQIHHGGSLSV